MESVIYYVYDILSDKTYSLVEKVDDDYFMPRIVRHDGNFYIGDEGFDSGYYSIDNDVVRSIEKSEDVITKLKTINGEVNELTNVYTISMFD